MNENVVKCRSCGAYIHVYNKKECCGINYEPVKPFEYKSKRGKEKKIKPVKPTKKRWKTQIPKHIRELVLKRDANKCVKCGSGNSLHLHHIQHRKFGGKHTAENLVTLCARCHANEHLNEPVYNILQKNIG